jgi:DNA-binding Xre family transcriptional regulator
MNIEERMREIILTTNIKSKELEIKTGIDRDRWNNLRKTKPTAKVRAEEVEALIDIFPNFAYWMTTGKEIPESGQFSPQHQESIN